MLGPINLWAIFTIIAIVYFRGVVQRYDFSFQRKIIAYFEKELDAG
jgi:hypothetical protein